DLEEPCEGAAPVAREDARQDVPRAAENVGDKIDGVGNDFAHRLYDPRRDVHDDPDEPAEPLVAASAPPVAILFDALLDLLLDVAFYPRTDVVTDSVRHKFP